jgi:hypothetical protein
MRRWKVWVLVGGAAVTLGLFLFSTGAGAATRKAVPRLWGGGVGACRTLSSDPAAVKDMQALRAEHQKEMQAWWQKYGSDPSSTAAQQALQKLRQEHWDDMQQLLKKYGVTAPSTRPGAASPGWGRGMMGGGYGGCWRANGAASPGASGNGAGYGPGAMGGYGSMMGQSL